MKSIKSYFLLGIIFFFALTFLNLKAFAARDTSFGNGGSATAVFPPVNSGGLKIKTLPGGKILSAGKTYGNGTYGELVLAEFNADGSPDTSFGNGGKTVLTNFESVYELLSLDRKPDGNILVTGSFHNASLQLNYFIAQFLPNGMADKTFANNGLLIIADKTVTDVEVQPDGKFLIAGSADPNNNTLRIGCVVRYTSGGQVDATFAGGLFTTTFGDTIRVKFDSVKYLSADRILVGGTAGGLNGTAYVVLAMLDGAGNLVSGFGTNGKVQSYFSIRNFSGDFSATVVLPNGRIYVLYNSLWVAVYSDTGNLQQNKKLAGLGGALDFSSVGGRIVIRGYPLVNSLFYTLVTYNEYLKPLNYLTPDFFWSDFALQSDGKILVTGQGVANPPTTPAGNLSVVRYLSFNSIIQPQLDFNGDGKSDVGVCRDNQSRPICYILSSAGGYRTVTGITPTAAILPEDYNGDGLADLANWGISSASNPQQGVFNGIFTDPQGANTIHFLGEWGIAGDVPLGGDYDGDAKTDFAVYRQGTWYVLRSSDNSMQAASWGLSTDKPVPADYDGDGKTDFAVYRPSSGLWAISQSSNQAPVFAQFGLSEDKPVPADFDGDGKTDLAVYRPSSGVWYEMKTTEGFAAMSFGIATDRPVPADYDGDGKTDIAVFRPAAGDWYFLNSSDGFGVVHWGTNGDAPLTTAYSAY